MDYTTLGPWTWKAYTFSLVQNISIKKSIEMQTANVKFMEKKFFFSHNSCCMYHAMHPDKKGSQSETQRRKTLGACDPTRHCVNSLNIYPI